MLGINLISGILQRQWRNDGGEGVVDDERNDADNNQEALWRPRIVVTTSEDEEDQESPRACMHMRERRGCGTRWEREIKREGENGLGYQCTGGKDKDLVLIKVAIMHMNP